MLASEIVVKERHPEIIKGKAKQFSPFYFFLLRLAAYKTVLSFFFSTLSHQDDGLQQIKRLWLYDIPQEEFYL